MGNGHSAIVAQARSWLWLIESPVHHVASHQTQQLDPLIPCRRFSFALGFALMSKFTLKLILFLINLLKNTTGNSLGVQ